MALAIGPPAAAVWFGASWLSLGAGAAVWAVSVAVKFALARASGPPLAALEPLAAAAIDGAVSAVCELGAAAIALALLAPLPLIDAVGFGVGAGSGEVVYILALSLSGAAPPDDVVAAWLRGARRSFCVRYAVPIERLSAVVGHAGARGLVYLAIDGSHSALWALPAVALFGVIDGIAVYGARRNWPWHEPTVCRRAQGAFAALAAAELLLFMIAAGN